MGIKSLGKPEAANNHQPVSAAPATPNHASPTEGRWEYTTMTYNYSYGSTTYVVNGEKAVHLKNIPLHDVLTHYGQNGWELVSISEGVYILKRQGVREIDIDQAARNAAK